MNEYKRRHAASGLLCAGMIAAAALGAIAPAFAQPEAAQPTTAHTLEARQQYAIPAGDLGKSLDQLADQNRLQIGYQPQHLAGKTAPALEGEYSLREALGILLSETGLEARFVSDKAIVVRSVADAGADAGNVPGGTGEATAVAQAAEANPDADPGVAAPGEKTTANVEVSRQGGIEEIIVTGQKKAERIQDVPIAISAFSMEDLDAQKIEGGFDLLKNVPNVTFSKTNFSGYNFQIRGIGTQAISATTDPGVAVSFNNTTLIVNRLFEQEYLDVERVEVLRGPQGTLYGRNATAGVINVISAKPEINVWESDLKGELGNYAARRFRGHVNIPLVDDTLAARIAYALTQRDGYGKNTYDGSDVDDRDLWTGRVTLGWQASDDLRFNLIWERFEEDDQRVRTSKQLCTRDTRANDIFTGTAQNPMDVSQYRYGALSQGCMAGSLYADEAFNTPNGASLPYISGLYYSILYGSTIASWVGGGQLGLGGNPYHLYTGDPADLPCAAVGGFFPATYPIDICRPDVFGGRQSSDLRTISSVLQPRYKADADLFELSFDYQLNDSLVFSSQTVYARDTYYATQDFNRFQTQPIFVDSREVCGAVGGGFAVTINCTDDPDFGRGTYAPLTDLDGDGVIDQNRKPVGDFTVDGSGYVRDGDGRRVGFYRELSPGGVVCDPQLGCSDTLFVQDLSRVESRQFNQEVRLVSSYDGPWNFSLGANFTRFETYNDYFVFSNALTHLLNFFPFQHHESQCVTGVGYQGDANNPRPGTFCRYVDPNPLASIDGDGHNYFRSANPYELTSQAIFGEAYWQASEALKFTAGLRLTWDRKVFTPIPSQLLLGDYRELTVINPGDGPERCAGRPEACPLAGNAPGGRGYVADPDIVQQWREPTGRVGFDWKPDFGLGWTDETLVYLFLSRGYKGGGANPPSIAPPAGLLAQKSSGGFAVPPTFRPEYVNAIEIGSKNTLFDGAVTLNTAAFYYDYSDYQVSKILNRSAVNENFDATVWGLELESLIAPTPELLFNLTVGYLRTRIADGEESIDMMDRTDGGKRHYVSDDPRSAWPEGFDEWVVVQPFVTAPSNCIVPAMLIEAMYRHQENGGSILNADGYCPGGNFAGATSVNVSVPYFDAQGNFVPSPANSSSPGPGQSTRPYNPLYDAPNGGQGFAKDLSGNELPGAPRWTFAFGGQYTFYLPLNMDLTARADFYWQDKSFHRVYNMPDYDRLKAWTNTNFSLWLNKPDWGLKVEVYVKNAFNETPITGAFLNSDDTGLTTNVFTLDPRLFGLSFTKSF